MGFLKQTTGPLEGELRATATGQFASYNISL